MYIRPGAQPGPSINICPNCHSPKTPNQALCTACNSRSCPNGHIMAGTARICAICNWVDPKARPQSSLYSTGRTSAKTADAGPPANLCPVCKNRVDPGTTQCPFCGNLVGVDYEQYVGAQSAPAYTSTPEPPQRESVVVFQQSIGTHDKKRTYACPRCGSRIDNPRSGHCPNCGYVGSMQYDITQRQPQWASPPPNNVPPPRYNPPSSPGYTQPAQATVTSIPSSPRSKPPAYAPPPEKPSRPEMPLESTCPKCGAPNAGESRFCGNCGYRYGTGKMSQKITTMSIEDRSYAAAAAGNVMNAPIYDTGAGEALIEPGEVEVKKGKRTGKGKESTRVRAMERTGERKFPMGLMMAVMVVAALIVALVIYVVSGGMRSNEPLQTADGPKLTNVTFTPNADGSMQVKWTTDKSATGQVMFCDPAGLCSWTDLDSSYSKEHSITMANIKPNVAYHVTVESIDQEGNKGQFESDQTFTSTKATSTTDSTAPKIADVATIDVTDIGFVVKWTTNEPATSQVEYGTTKSYGSFTSIDSKLKTAHVFTVYGVSPNSQYYVRVVSADADGNTAKEETPTSVITQNAVAEGIQVGNRASDFELNNLSGNSVKLSSFRGKKMVIVNFWATWCDPCMQEMPLFQKVKTGWAGSDRLEILAVDKGEQLATVQSAITSNGYTFAVLLDSGTVSNKYVVGNTIPITYFIDTQGIIRHVRSSNFGSQADIENILNTLN